MGVLSAASRLRERLGRVLHIFRENAFDLFPELKARRNKVDVAIFRRGLERERRQSSNFHLQQNTVGLLGISKRQLVNGYRFLERQATPSNADPGSYEIESQQVPVELQLFSQDISTLLDCFCRFPDFLDEFPDQSLTQEMIVSIATTDLNLPIFTSHYCQRWAKTLDDFQG